MYVCLVILYMVLIKTLVNLFHVRTLSHLHSACDSFFRNSCIQYLSLQTPNPNISNTENHLLFIGMVQANEVARPMSRHSDRTPLVLGGTQLHGELNIIIFFSV